MRIFEQKIEAIVSEAERLLREAGRSSVPAMPGGAYFLSNNDVLALPRDQGDSRYPYGQNGFNFWVYASGYMHCNEGLFSHFLRAAEGQEPNIAFFAGLPRGGKDSYDVASLMPAPRLAGQTKSTSARRYTILSSNAAYFVTLLPTLRFVVRAFATTGKDLCFSLHAHNLTGREQTFFVSSYLNPFLRHQIFETGEDRWFKEVQLLSPLKAQGKLGSFLVKVNEDKDRLHSVSHWGVVRRGLAQAKGSRLTKHHETTSRYQFVGGSCSSLHTPASLARGAFGAPRPLCTFTETAVAGDVLHLKLKGKASARLDIVFSHTDDTQLAQKLARQPVAAAEIDAQLADLEKDDDSRHHALTARFGRSSSARLHEGVLNPFMEHLKRQVEFCSLIKGYIQLSPNSLIGIRDVFQALEALVFWRPSAARAKMLEALGFTAPDGRCFRQYSLPSSTGEVGRMDLRPFIDQGVWVISTIATYLRVTGDLGFLDEQCGYHEIVDEDRGRVKPSDQRGSVLEHLFKILDYLLEMRDHDLTGCVRALYGDWNDALDGLGVSQTPGQAYGSGVSVMATLQVYQNCHEMIEVLSALDPRRHTGRIEAYREAGAQLAKALSEHAVVNGGRAEKRILHGWGDKKSYKVGSFDDPDGQSRDGLTSNAFWVLSGMLERDPSLAKPILNAMDRLDDKYGFKTFEPAFADYAPGVGRIRKLPPGTAENGATYVHATAFAVMALFKMGRPREAWDQLIKIFPFTDIHRNLSHSPFVMPNAYGHNQAKHIDGQNMNDWQTGSSNVVLKTLIRYVFGLEPAMDGLWVQPAWWSPFRSFSFSGPVRGCDVRVVFEDRGSTQRTFTVNGQPRGGSFDPALGVEKLWIPSDELRPGKTIEVRVQQRRTSSPVKPR